MNIQVKERIKTNAVKNLKEFGYAHTTLENIVSDEVYKILYIKLLKENLGNGFDEEIKDLLNECGEK